MKEGDVFQRHYEVSQSVYEGFRNTFQDHNPMHMDETFAQSKGYRERVMYGNILNGFLSHFVGECLPVKNVVIQTQSIQYARPVFLNDRLQLTAEISGVFESVNTVEFKFRFENAAGEKVAKGKLQIGIL
jgi:3-hydroxybutyryl-CoA dehydratase